jgi:P-type conjugative transfer protein TrbJ
MTRKKRITICLAVAIVISSVILTFKPAEAIPVFDAANYSENMLTAARTLAQINNQIQSLQNQATMIQNMALNLQRMDFSSVQNMTNALQQIDVLMGQAQGISYNVSNTNSMFQQLYPQQYAAAVSANQLVLDAHGRWQTSMDGFRQTMTVQSQVVQNVQSDGQLLNNLVNQSQGSVGALQAQQATNQLIALSTKQQLQIQTMMATQFRAEAAEAARKAESQEQGRAASQTFLGSRQFYPGN